MGRCFVWGLLLAISCAPAASLANEPLDVVGIRTGTTPQQAMAAITAHNPRIKKFLPRGPITDPEVLRSFASGSITQATVRGLPAFVELIDASDTGPKIMNFTIPGTPTVASEGIFVFFVPGPPQVVYGVQRRVEYKQGQEAGLASVLGALKAKYGQPSRTQEETGMGLPGTLVLEWFFGVDGKPVSSAPVGCSDTRVQLMGVSRALMEASSIEGSTAGTINNQAKCGPFVRASLPRSYGNRDLLFGADVMAVDAPLLRSGVRAAYEKKVAGEGPQKAREAAEGDKRGGGKF